MSITNQELIMSENKPLPMGISDFKEMREKDFYYVDKTFCIKELVEAQSKVVLLPRPRRFGKTLTLSMLRYFFEKSNESQAALFDGLAVSQFPEIMKHQGQYPVIFFTFKEAKQPGWEACFTEIMRVIRHEYERHAYLLESNFLLAYDRTLFKNIMMQHDDPALYRSALKNLSYYLEQYHGVKPIILIDEYDAPVHGGYEHGYYDKIIDFIRSFLGAGLKDNNSLNFSVITGILRIAKESIFSGLNNIVVYSLINNKYAESFGFTQGEVDELLTAYNLTNLSEEIKHWYNGYTVGKNTGIYNPWSIINFVNNRELGPYWLNTSDNLLVKRLVTQSPPEVKQELELLLTGHALEKKLNESLVLTALEREEGALWSLLLQTGYLSCKEIFLKGRVLTALLCIPNEEVRSFYDDLIEYWMTHNSSAFTYLQMLAALTSGQIESFKDYFTAVLLNSVGLFDTGGQQAEKFYHALVLGMLVSLSETHDVISNRESGFGRYDIMIIPKELTGPDAAHKPGIIIEFKSVNKRTKETLKKAAENALAQIEERQYHAQLVARGVKKIIKLAIAFDGKKSLIQEATS